MLRKIRNERIEVFFGRLRSDGVRVCAGILWLTIGALPVMANDAAEPQSLKDRVLWKETIVRASVEEVWHIWTTTEGVTWLFADEANIELRVGGKYEWYFDMSAPKGQRGAEGCTVLSFLPYEMIAFTWNAPPKIPALRAAEARTQVVVRLEPIGNDRVKVILAQHGYGEGPDWEAYYQYFDRAWGIVLDTLHDKLSTKADRPTAPPRPKESARSPNRPGDRVLTWQVTVAAPVTDVWNAFTTKKGIEAWMVPLAAVDFRIGGTIKTNYHANGVIGDDSTITHHILSYEPQRMMSIRVTAPASAPVAKITEAAWHIYYFKPIDAGHTRYTLKTCGWGEGPDWDAAEAFFQRGNDWTLQQLVQRFANSEPSAAASMSQK